VTHLNLSCGVGLSCDVMWEIIDFQSLFLIWHKELCNVKLVQITKLASFITVEGSEGIKNAVQVYSTLFFLYFADTSLSVRFHSIVSVYGKLLPRYSTSVI